MLSAKALSRNVRNHNPLNIEWSAANDWKGQTGSDGRFAMFVDDEHGFRAAAQILKKYQRPVSQKGYGLKTLHDIIYRWAPPSENDSEGYAAFVAKEAGVSMHKPILLESDPDLFARVMLAMSRMEGAEKDQYTIAQARNGAVMV